MNPRFVLAYVGLALSQLAQGHAGPRRRRRGRRSPPSTRAAPPTRRSAWRTSRWPRASPPRLRSLLEKGIEADLAAKDEGSAAVKLAALAGAHLDLKQTGPALAAADRAVSLGSGKTCSTRRRASTSAPGKEAKALALATQLSTRLEQDPQAYAELIRGEAELLRGKPREAIKTLENARKIADTWMGHFLLGRAYLEAGAFPDADRELETCLKRRGEATALFLDEAPTWRYFAAGRLLPRPRERGAQEPRRGRRVQGVPGEPPERLRRPPRRRRAQTPRSRREAMTPARRSGRPRDPARGARSERGASQRPLRRFPREGAYGTMTIAMYRDGVGGPDHQAGIVPQPNVAA